MDLGIDAWLDVRSLCGAAGLTDQTGEGEPPGDRQSVGPRLRDDPRQVCRSWTRKTEAAEMIKTAGKQFDPRSQQLYFVAVGPSDLGAAAHVNANILCAVNNMA